MTTTQTEIEFVTDEELTPFEDDGNTNDHHTHIINPAMNRHVKTLYGCTTAKDIVFTARSLRIEIVALCGYKWIPKRNPEKYDACQSCLDIAGRIISEDG